MNVQSFKGCGIEFLERDIDRAFDVLVFIFFTRQQLHELGSLFARQALDLGSLYTLHC